MQGDGGRRGERVKQGMKTNEGRRRECALREMVILRQRQRRGKGGKQRVCVCGWVCVSVWVRCYPCDVVTVTLVSTARHVCVQCVCVDSHMTDMTGCHTVVLAVTAGEKQTHAYCRSQTRS